MISMSQSSHGRTMSLALALGFLGATALILAAMFFAPGKFILVPYGAFVVAIAVVLRSARVPTYRERFVAGLGAFMVATLALYIYTARIGGHVSPIGHAWRLAVVIAIGVALNAAIARVSE